MGPDVVPGTQMFAVLGGFAIFKLEKSSKPQSSGVFRRGREEFAGLLQDCFGQVAGVAIEFVVFAQVDRAGGQ